MNMDQNWRLRLSVLATLVQRSQVKPGRTALMKFAYLLQTARGVPLGYRFELYNYGPYDGTVLSDISQAMTLKAIKSETVHYPSGLGYEYSSGEGHTALCSRVKDQLEKFENDIEWIVDHFGRESAAKLELISTIVFAEREMKRKRQRCSRDVLSMRVKRIKPHFDEATIVKSIDDIAANGLIAVE